MPTITLSRTNHKAFIDGLQQGSAELLYTAENKARIEAYVPGFLYGVTVDSVDSYTFRQRGRYYIDSVNVTYSSR